MILRRHREDGVALIVAIMAMTLLSVLGSALVLTTMTEAGVSATYADGIEAFYAADGAVERTLADLREAPDWSAMVGSRFDGPAASLISGADIRSSIRLVVSVREAAQPGALVVRGQASTPRGIERTVEATIARTDELGSPGFRLLAWRDLR